tara:strand:+ start:750 stop:1184 length:435 start_codon:yes stop_codon:yes gene_type:complete
MGRNKAINKPELIWEMFEKYREEVKSQPRLKIEYVGKDGERVETPIERPLSLDGFYVYGYDNGYTLHHYFDNPDGRYDEYRGISTRVRKAIRAEQIDGAMVNAYNPNLTARINSITEKTQATISVEQPIFKSINLDVSENDSPE